VKLDAELHVEGRPTTLVRNINVYRKPVSTFRESPNPYLVRHHDRLRAFTLVHDRQPYVHNRREQTANTDPNTNDNPDLL
jgi:hypothetical protein